MTAPVAARPLTILDAIYGRRSIRAFVPTPLDPTLIRALLDAAVQAPTAMHEEPWEFLVLQDRAVLHRLSERVKQALHRRVEAGGGSPASREVDPRFAEFAARLAAPDVDVFYDAPAVVAIGSTGGQPFATADCWLAAANLMLAAWGLGVGSCCIGAAIDTLNAAATKRELALPPELTIVAVIAIGVAATDPAPTGRRAPRVLAWR